MLGNRLESLGTFDYRAPYCEQRYRPSNVGGFLAVCLSEHVRTLKGRGMTPCYSEAGEICWLYHFLFWFWMVYLYFVKDYGYWEQRKIPHVPAVFPFGSLTKVVVGSNYQENILDKVYTSFEGERFVGFNNVREPSLLLRDPDLIKSIMTDQFEYFKDFGWMDINPKDPLMWNLPSKTGEAWRTMRRKISPAYEGVHLGNLIPLLWKSTESLLNDVERQAEERKCTDVKDTLGMFCMKIFAAFAFGTDVTSSSKEDETFYRACQKALDTDFRAKLKIFIYFAFPIVSKVHIFNMIDTEIWKVFDEKVRSAVRLRDSTNTQTCDFLSLLIKVKNNECIFNDSKAVSKDNHHPSRRKGVLTVEEIVVETAGFFMLGHEKTAVVLQFCLYELACNESIQERLFQEIQAVFKKYNDDLQSSAALDDMTYLDQVINETLRHYPVFTTSYRKCTRDYKMPESDLVVEKGLRLLIPQYSIQHDPKYFPDPFIFNPDRFSYENCRKRHPWAFLPFGIGPRKCIGYRLGLMTVKLAVARLLFNFHVSLTPDTPVPLQFANDSYFTKPSTHIKLIFSKR